jgi:hypothetical protein
MSANNSVRELIDYTTYTWNILILPSPLRISHPIVFHPSSLCIPCMLHIRSFIFLSSCRYFGDLTANLYSSSMFHFLYSCPYGKRRSFILTQKTGKMIRYEVCTQRASKFSAIIYVIINVAEEHIASSFRAEYGPSFVKAFPILHSHWPCQDTFLPRHPWLWLVTFPCYAPSFLHPKTFTVKTDTLFWRWKQQVPASYCLPPIILHISITTKVTT